MPRSGRSHIWWFGSASSLALRVSAETSTGRQRVRLIALMATGMLRQVLPGQRVDVVAVVRPCDVHVPRTLSERTHSLDGCLSLFGEGSLAGRS
jgi:hypothetical protein